MSNATPHCNITRPLSGIHYIYLSCTKQCAISTKTEREGWGERGGGVGVGLDVF